MSDSAKPPLAGIPPLSSVSTDAILESISDGVFTVDRSWRITSFNRAAEQITGVSRSDALGKRCAEVFRASMCEGECALRHTLETGSAVVNQAGFIVDARARRIPISVSTALFRDEHGEVVGGAETFRDLTLVEELRKEIEGRHQVGDIVARSVAMRRVLDALPLIAESDSTVVIEGEDGTGKELLARAIHAASWRSSGPFVAVSCGAFPETLLESELFGYRAGAFSGAVKDKPGRFALAEGGSLLLDEIGEMSPALQVRLLRVLQEKAYEPLGSTRSQKADVRVLVATTRKLADLTQTGALRHDLFYRLNVIALELPPLRTRREDIPLLVEHFLTLFNATQNKRITGVGSDALGVLMAHGYPGNVRELYNIIEHASVLCAEGAIELGHLPTELVPVATTSAGKGAMEGVVKVLEAEAIRQALRNNQNSRLAAARELGVHKSTLFRKVKSCGLELPDKDGRARRGRAPRT
jgi:PAS domain S-box-containing protein